MLKINMNDEKVQEYQKTEEVILPIERTDVRAFASLTVQISDFHFSIFRQSEGRSDI